ncbi:MAG TPA: immunoglobulin domain-containing protein [Verrucomicrobiae bacterium]|jgi:autotransporter-associated beta strand protein
MILLRRFDRVAAASLPVFSCMAALFAGFAAQAQDVWTGADFANSTNWADAANWQAGAAPLPNDSLDFSGGQPANFNNFPVGTPFSGITFDGAASVSFNLDGAPIILSGAATGNSTGVANNSSEPQTVSLGLGLDWGNYQFYSSASSPAVLTYALGVGLGSAAWLDANVSDPSMSVDPATGLINNVEGAGLFFAFGTNTPTGLATLSGANVVAYNGYTPAAPGAIGNGNNINLTAAGSSAAYTANNNTVNTISAAQTGNSGGTATSTVTTTGTLTFGSMGGVYLLGNTLGSKGCLTFANGGVITAGASTNGATLLFAVNGNNANNQLSVNCAVQNNASGGAVTLIKTGPGSMNLATSTSNNYSGGTYINQGQLQWGSASQLGSGPVYIAAGANAYYTGAGTVPNAFYLSPGLGSPTANAVANAGALSYSGNGLTFAGAIHLLGAPVTVAPGDRINNNFSSGDTITFSGQITGTGTLDVWGSHTCNYLLANANTNTPNDWQGGLILEAHSGVAANTYFKMGANNQIPSGPNAGNVTLIPATSAVYARLDLNGFNATINGLISSSGGSFAQVGDFGNVNSTLTFGANDATASFAGSTSDGGPGKALSLVKIGAGTETFSGALSHYGATIVSNGTFALQGTMPNSTLITVAPGAILDASATPTGGLLVGASQTLTGTGLVDGATTLNGSAAAIMAVSGIATNIGTLTDDADGGAVTINGGSTNVWYINNDSGAAGSASGWSLISITNGSLSLNASPSSQIHIKVVSLTASGSPGSAAFNPNVNHSWLLVQTPSAISGFSGSGQFAIDTSSFANNPGGASQFSVTTNDSGDSLILTFTSTPVITSPLSNQTNNAGGTAVFAVSASGPAPITYEWLQGGTTALVSGQTSAGGALVTITTNVAGTSSTLTLAGVEDLDDGAISVLVTNGAAGTGISTANLAVIDPPVSPSIAETGAQTINSGGVTYLGATTLGGTQPLSYIWSFNGSVISGATASSLGVQVSPAAAGSYQVVISNAAGNVTAAPFVIGTPTAAPGQLIYEPFTSYGIMSGPSAPYTWAGVTNLFNQATGEPAYWQHESGSRTSLIIDENPFATFVNNNAPGYPWPGLAGDSTQAADHDVSSSSTDNDQLYFWNHGASPGQSVYFSFILNCDSLGAANVSDCIAAFCDSSSSTSFNLKLSTQIQTDGSYWLGLSKGSGTTGNQGVDANTQWATGFQADQDIFVVGCYQVNSGLVSSNDDTVAMWFDPTNTTFGTTNVPAPSLGPSTFGVANSDIHAFEVHGVQLPGNRYFSDLRIGTAWASVTPMSAPNLTLANVTAMPGATATLASQNAGNPVTTYKWYFNGTNGTPLADGPNPTGDGSTISNSATGALTIIGVTAADLGTYTVVGQNNDPISGAALTGSASGMLSFPRPPLTVAYQTPNVIVAWPTNFAGFELEQTPSLAPASWAIVAPNTYVVSGTNETVAVNPSSGGSQFFRLIGP